MFATFKQIFTPRNKELRKRILFTLGCLAIFIIGTTISIPNTNKLSGDLGFLELLNSIGGGALKRGSIFGLGVMPYISASIIIQLFTMNIIPYFTAPFRILSLILQHLSIFLYPNILLLLPPTLPIPFHHPASKISCHDSR